jgi:phenylacetate-CoA ligase
MLRIKPEEVLKDLKTKGGDYWTETGKKETLRLFHEASRRVPAYKDFLRKNKLDPAKIKTLKDFAFVPPTDKANYFQAYPYQKLFWDGDIKKPLTIHSTSGSTGEASYFHREFGSDLIREVIIENFFRQNPMTTAGPTLFIVTFGMGVWSAGVGIYTASYLAGNLNDLPISIISPGVNKIEVLKILKKLAPNFQQVIIAGYPPFVKDIIDDALVEKIDLKRLNLRFVFTGEAFTEEFRDYLVDKIGMKNIFTDTMNTYGTSELGAVAVETPLAILGRRLAYKNKAVFKGLFGDIVKTPTLAQYIPHFINFDCVGGELFLTGDSAAPLVRYQSGDHGGILTSGQFREILSHENIHLEKEIKKYGISGKTNELPLVFVYERKNLATTLYGILIYPEFIRTALFDKSLGKFLSGKFTMQTRYDQMRNQYIEINLELKKNIGFKKGYEKLALRKIIETLRRKSSEFRELAGHLKKKAFPRLIFWPYEHPAYFTPGNKQKWVKKI